MKKWEKPEIMVYDVKMDENIAASGDESRPKESGITEIRKGPGEDRNTIKTLTYYTDTNTIIETNYGYIPYKQGLFDPTGGMETASSISDAIDMAGCR